MELAQNKQKAQELVRDLTIKCWEDENFKTNLLDNPKNTIEEFLGKKINLPEGKEFKVVDQTDNRYIYFNIDGRPNFDNIELTDEQLEAVSGGIIGIIEFFYDIFCGSYDSGAGVEHC